MLGFLAVTFCFGGCLSLVGILIARPQINAASNKFLTGCIAGMAPLAALVLFLLFFLYVFMPLLACLLIRFPEEQEKK